MCVCFSALLRCVYYVCLCVCVCEESVRRQRERSIKYLVPWYHGTWYRRISLIQS